MSLRDQIVSLEALAAVDADLRRLEDQITAERGILADLKSELSKLDDKLAADRASVSEMEKTRNELVTEVRQMASQIERSREKLSRSRNERESNAAQRELEELRKLQRDREDEMNKLATLSEAAKKTIDETDERSAQDRRRARRTRVGYLQVAHRGGRRARRPARRSGQAHPQGPAHHVPTLRAGAQAQGERDRQDHRWHLPLVPYASPANVVPKALARRCVRAVPQLCADPLLRGPGEHR